MIGFVLSVGAGIVLFVLAMSFKTIRPKQRGLVETFGKYSGYRGPGLSFIIPLVQRLIKVNVSEQMSNIRPQEIITKDNLNARVDLVVYYKIKAQEEHLKKAVYNVDDIDDQLETLARTTARNVIGRLNFTEVNGERDELNDKIRAILVKETNDWGVEVMKVELKDIVPPQDVQDAMNNVIKAENEKIASVNLAKAAENVADGKRMAAIKEAEGQRTASILVAEGQAKAFNLIRASFTGNAQKLKQLEAMQASLQNNSKVIITEKGIKPNIILGNLLGKE